MDVHEFHKDFLEEVKATANAEGAGSNSAFVSVAMSYLVNAEVLSDFTEAFYIGQGKNNRRIRVDGYTFDDFDESCTLVIADYTGDENREIITKTAANSLFDRLLYFIEESYGHTLYRVIEESLPASDLVDQLRAQKESIRKFRLILISDGFMSNRIKEIEPTVLNGIPVERQIWDVDRIFNVCFSDTGRQDIEIDFRALTNGRGLPCIEASVSNTDDYKSYLCIIPGTVLADIYDKYGSQLLEGNVRSFLSTKVAVNKKIRETILRNPDNFFAYNNGVSATAMELLFDNTPQGRVIKYARDFQIINGGQTTASLSNARFKDKADLTKVYVQMKLTEVDSNAERSGELIRNISRSSNSQNKVSDADFFSTHPFHIRMEQYSRKLYANPTDGKQYSTKWFYERARGQYLQAQMHLTKSAKDKFIAQNPKSQVVTKTDLAKVRNTWDELPHVVSKGAQTNFMAFANSIDAAWEKSEINFNEKYFKDSVALMILFKHTEWLVSNQDWYESGYRANIVTYSLALLHRLIAKQYPRKYLDLQLIWNRQQIPEVITKELARITKTVFSIITSSERETINVTQWCKREACWSQVKECSIILSKEVERVLISADERKSLEREAKQDQQLISEVDAQKAVIELGADFWTAVRSFSYEKRLGVSPSQEQALKAAVKIPIKLPNPMQCRQLLALLDEAKSNGFKKEEIPIFYE